MANDIKNIAPQDPEIAAQLNQAIKSNMDVYVKKIQQTAELEAELLKRVNAQGTGPQGFGGRTTALSVHVETFPSQIASLPVAVNIQCHSARHKETVL